MKDKAKGGIIPAEVYHAYADIVKAKKAESDAFEQVFKSIEEEQAKASSNNPMSRDELITAMALSRGKHFTINDALRKDIMSGKAMTNFSVNEGGAIKGGRTYDFASDMFRKSFIGRYFNENKDKLPKGMSIQINEYTSQPITKGFNIGLFQGDRGDGKPNRIGGIGVSILGQTAHTSNTGVISEMRGNKLSDVLMSELAERLRSMGVKYLDGVIIDPLQRPYHARMRTIGNAETIAGTYYDTTRSTLDPTAYYSVGENDKGGRTYTDEQFKSKFIGKVAAKDPELTEGLQIRANNNVVKLLDEKGTEIGMINTWHGEGVTVSSSGESFIEPSYRGMGYGKLLYSEMMERLRSQGISEFRGTIADPKKRPIKIRESIAGNTKFEVYDTVTKTYKYLNAEDGRLSQSRYESTGRVSNKLDADAWYSVNEGDKGGRTYDTRSLKWKKGFIGRYASENPDMTKEVKLSFQTEKASNRGSPVMAGRIDGRTTSNHYLQITEAGKEVGHITWKTTVGRDGRTMFADPSVSVEPQYRGKNFQHLLYSEAAERARAMGNTDFFQRIENDLGLPLKSQVKTFGEKASKLLDQYTGQYMEPTMENFNKLKFPEMEIHHTDADGNVTKID